VSWSEIRKQVLNRDGWECAECCSKISGRHAHVHHKIPRALGGYDELDNLVSLCSSCHSLKHMNLQASLGRRLIERLALKVARLFDSDIPADLSGDKLGIALRYLNVQRLRNGQLQPILAALAGKSVLFISPTGSGKSLCFQVPALIASNKSIVISPLKALMTDQVHGLMSSGVPATFINSDLPKVEKQVRLELISAGKVKLIYLAPERLEPKRSRENEHKAILNTKTDFLVVDEAHVIDKWGDSFRPHYSNIKASIKPLGSPPILAFTATAGRATRRQIIDSLGIKDAEIFVEGVDRTNIALARFRSHDDEHRSLLIKQLFQKMRKTTDGKALIFVPTKKIGEKVEGLLRNINVNSEFFHGKLTPGDRDFILGRFEGRIQPQLNILICTNAFGMGMDIPNVRLVVHWQHPASAEDYLQEFGRAGRDGKQSLAVLFIKSDDMKIPDFLLRKTLEKLPLSEDEWQSLYDKKRSSITLMSTMAEDTHSCLTQMLKDELDVDRTSRKAFARFILEMIFSRRQKIASRKYCCDGCYRKQKRTGKVSDFALEVIEGMR
jgi:RecQ family ATP-dependent DNA helicase